jgi:hypothetical protein
MELPVTSLVSLPASQLTAAQDTRDFPHLKS